MKTVIFNIKPDLPWGIPRDGVLDYLGIWDMSPPDGVPWTLHRESLYDAMLTAAFATEADRELVGGRVLVVCTRSAMPLLLLQSRCDPDARLDKLNLGPFSIRVAEDDELPENTKEPTIWVLPKAVIEVTQMGHRYRP